MESDMRKMVLVSLSALLALTPIAIAQSASFGVSQHGKPVGTASFTFTSTPHGYESSSLVRIKMEKLEYSLSKSERLSPANRLRNVQLSATVNGRAVLITAAPDTAPNATEILLDTSADGRKTDTRLPAHAAAVFLPDFDPGALETMLALAVAHNNNDLWAIIPKQAGSVEPIKLATHADEQGTLDGKPIVIHHLVATINGLPTELFSGPENQLLQAELPQKGFALVRNGFVLTPPAKAGAPPAETAN
jgi:hypothetical protein